MELIKIVQNLIESNPYFFIFLFMTIESCFIPFPSEIVMIPAWIYAAKWKISLVLAILIWTIWSLIWALINYLIWKYLWIKITKKLIWEKRYEAWINLFNKYWDIITFYWRLIPLVRQYISFPPWIFKMNIIKFSLYTFLWAWIWVSFLAILWYKIWENFEIIKKYKLIFLIILLILILLTIYIKLKIEKTILK